MYLGFCSDNGKKWHNISEDLSKEHWFIANAKYRWVNNFGRVVSKQHLYEHTEHIQCLEVTHSPEADIVAFHIPPTVTMSCQLFPSKAVESLLLCVC